MLKHTTVPDTKIGEKFPQDFQKEATCTVGDKRHPEALLSCTGLTLIPQRGGYTSVSECLASSEDSLLRAGVRNWDDRGFCFGITVFNFFKHIHFLDWPYPIKHSAVMKLFSSCTVQRRVGLPTEYVWLV